VLLLLITHCTALVPLIKNAWTIRYLLLNSKRKGDMPPAKQFFFKLQSAT